MTLEETLEKIHPADKTAMEAALAHWNNIAMPLHSLGRLQDTVVRIAGMTGNARVDLKKKALVVMCADNGVVEEGVTQSGQEVTKIVAENFLKEKATASILCKKAGADIFPVDIGIATDSTILQHKVMYGTKNMAKEPAMTRAETLEAIAAGIEIVRGCKADGCRIIATGEMGIGNTTTSAAMAAAMLRCDVATVTGRGAGLNDSGLERKIRVIESAIEKYDLYNKDTFEILMTVGGLDIAGLVGVCIGGALYHIPVVLDGVISMVSALAAGRLLSGVTDFIIPSHEGREPAVALLCEALSVKPVIRASLALGEGTGAVMMFALLDMALSVYKGRTTFDDISVSQYERYV